MLYDFLYEFSVVAREGNLSAAAERLGISRPSLGRHIDALEAQLGAHLLVRGPEGVQLTEDGRYALASAADVESLGETARRRCAGTGLLERNLVVGGFTDCATPLHILTDACSSFNGGVCSVSFRPLAPEPAASALPRLLSGRADLVVCFSGEAEGLAHTYPSLAAVPLCTVAAAVSVAPGHDLAAHGSVSLDDLGGFKVVRQLASCCADGAVWGELEHACDGGEGRPRPVESFYNSRYGLDMWRPDEVVLCCADSASSVRMREMGRSVIPVRNVSLQVCGLVKADDYLVVELVRQAWLSFAGGSAVRPATLESIYGSIPRNDVRVETLSHEEAGRLFAQVEEETPVAEDLVLPDGTVVDRVYVALRNRLNRIADGLSGAPVETSYEAITHLWSVEEARAVLEMPMFGLFTAYDYAVSSGRDEDACAALLEDLSRRGLLYRVRRGGCAYYSLLTWAYGMWEFQINNFDADFLNWGIYGSEQGTGSQFPVMHVCPISPDVVEGGRIAPYRDWEAYVRRQSTVCVAPCQCHVSKQILMPEEYAGDDHPGEVCFTFGEMAQYWLENGLGRQVSLQECLDTAHAAIEVHDLVPQFYYDQNPEVMCLCRPDFCLVLSALKSTGGLAASMPKSSAYTLRVDGETCIQCGACEARCPMGAVRLGCDGALRVDATCVACGQCVPVCPVDARILVQKDELAALPHDMLEGYRWRSEDRMARGYIADFTGIRLGKR